MAEKEPGTKPVGTSLSVNINAAPFKPAGSKTQMVQNINAMPFKPGERKGSEESSASSFGSPSSFKNINAQPFVPSKKIESEAKISGSELPELPDELTQGIDDLATNFAPDTAQNSMYNNSQMYEEEEGEEEYGIDAVLSRLTVDDISKPLQPGHSQLSAQFMNEQLSAFLLQRQQQIFAYVQPNNEQQIPAYIHIYHSLLPLDDVEMGRSSNAPAITAIKGVSSVDGLPYTLFRIHESQVKPSKETLNEAKEIVKRWAPTIGFPNIIGLRDAFLSDEYLGQGALYLVYDYHPKATSIDRIYLKPSYRTPIPESMLWNFAVQLTSLLVMTHAHNLYLGPILDASKVMITNKTRIRAGAIGLSELLQLVPAQKSIQELQTEDVYRVGQLILTLASRNTNTRNMDMLARRYSKQFVHFLHGILTMQKGSTAVYLSHMLGQHAFTELCKVNTLNDMLYENLYKEVQNGKLLRLMIQLGMINERPDDSTSVQWSESGDRYLLKLFRDFVFHQNTEDGKPNLDWGHVMEALNKLDAGVREQVLLVSRDEKTVMVVSYKDMKQAIISSYAELKSRATTKKSWR